MEYHLTKKSLSQPRFVPDAGLEQAVDVDLSLPDYCPDVEKILSCTLIPKIHLTNISGDRLNAEGSACIRLLYLDSEGCMRSYEYSRPFSESFPLKGDPSDGAAWVTAKPSYINCRALSPRKLSLHGAFTLTLHVVESAELDYCAHEDADDLQMRGEMLEADALCGLCCESFSVQEDVPLSGKEVGAVLSYRLSARITELKAIHNKIMLSAELRPELLYLSGAERKEAACMSYSLPVSRVIDCEGASEDCVIDGTLEVQSCELDLSDDALDGSALLSLDAKLSFCAMCYAPQEVEVLSDAFSTERDVQVQTAPFSCRSNVVCRSVTDVGKANVALDEEIGRILDVHCEKLSPSSDFADGSMLLSAKLCVGILYENADGEVRCCERDAVFSCKTDAEGCDEVLRLRAGVDSMSYRLTDSRHLELRAELCYRITLCRKLSCTAVTAVSADDDAPAYERESSLILYYADHGDTVWDIGKRFRSRPGDILRENGLENDDVGGGVMLLIP